MLKKYLKQMGIFFQKIVAHTEYLKFQKVRAVARSENPGGARSTVVGIICPPC